MSTSQNGFPVIESSGSGELTTIYVGGSSFRVLKRASVYFHTLLLALNAIEPFKIYGYDGGYALRPIRGQTSGYSNHASGTAVDVNAARHPRGSSRYAGWRLAARVKVLLLLKSGTNRMFRWGALYHEQPYDSMHFEILSEASMAKYGAKQKPAAVTALNAHMATMRRVQTALGVTADGMNGPATTGALIDLRLKAMQHGAEYAPRTASVQKAVGLTPLKDPRWGPKTDAALRKLGFHF